MALVAFPLLSALVLPDISRAVTKDKESLCESAEECFVSILLRGEIAASRENNTQLKIDRLRALQERHPGSAWAKRAGLLIGLLLSEREPAEGLRYLRAAEREVPLLQDYIRLWTAEALLNAGDTSQAARLLESLQDGLSDTLRTRAVFRSGEAWFRAGDCLKAIEALRRAVGIAGQDPTAPSALLKIADCQSRTGQLVESRVTLRQLWIRYPHTSDAREAYARLTAQDVEAWQPSADDLYARALVFYGLALHSEAVEELQKFLAAAGNHGRRDEARGKLGTALVRLKRYDQARQVFTDLAASQSSDAGEAAVWLARIYLRQDEGDRLLALRQALTRLSLTPDQKSSILLFEGNWLEDHGRYEDAIGRYRQAAQGGKDAPQRLEPLWRVGWIHYRTGQYKQAVELFKVMLASPDDPQFTPQALYWMARAFEQEKDPQALERYDQLCRQYPFSYYCQLAQLRPDPVQPAPNGHPPLLPMPAAPSEPQGEIVRDLRYRKAVELKILGREQEAAAELTSLIEQYARNRGQMLELFTLLGDAGAHHQALRLARLHFRDSLERGGDPVPTALWQVAYPMVYLPLIRSYASGALDPFLAAAIIREESLYDLRAVSRVGAIGLMQLMPTTAQTVARSLGLSQVIREELFDRDINIRFGVRYLEQLLQQFSGNLIYTIAAYNAGPPAVNSWIVKYGDRQPDEFVELIPYQETRQYVKRVLRSYREYRRLGGEGCSSRFLDKVC